MPCRDYESDRGCSDIKERLDSRTKMLCSVLTKAEQAGVLHKLKLTPNEKTWWVEHQMEDAAERKRLLKLAIVEGKRKAALEKLTPDERKLLGL
jgi:hypothetical protein